MIPHLRIGQGYDVHAFAEGRKLILGGVEIPHSKGLLGHSDADVLSHALMDALLGALALGDIGKHFPDTDPEFAGADSIKLLTCIADMIRERGWQLLNADITLMMERPKIASHADRMRDNLAAALFTEKENISVKATTTEKLGFIGREEGVAASAVVLLAKKGDG